MSTSESEIQEESEEKISVCDVMKSSTSKIIQKHEYQAPATFQQFADLYTAFLHSMDDFYGTCYISEKEFFDNLNIDQGVLKQFQKFSKTFTETYMNQLDLYSAYRQEIIQMQMSSLKVFDNYMHSMMDSYAKTLSQFNKFTSY